MLKDELKPCDLHALFDYDADTGVLRWKLSIGNRIKVGMKCGSVDGKGSLRLQIYGRTYGAHQIVFAIYNGRWPSAQIDHIDRNKLNNQIENLREATNAENSRNRTNARTLKYRGVSLHKGDGLYHARIMVDGHALFLGRFHDSMIAAHEYNKAAIIHHGEFAIINPVGA